MIGAIIGGLSAVASGISAVQNMNAAKRANESAKNFTNQLMNLQEQNAYKGLQVPDIQKLQQDYINRSQTQSIDALQSAGPEAVLGGVSGVNQNAIDAGAQATQDQAALMSQRDQQVAQAQQGINERQALRQGNALSSLATGAGLAAANLKENANNAVTGMFSSLGGVATDVMDNENYDQWLAKNKNKTAGLSTNASAGLSTVPTYQDYLYQNSQNQGMNLLSI
jgi:methylmalonyl-CoA mutase cobalamin-binding subunit